LAINPANLYDSVIAELYSGRGMPAKSSSRSKSTLFAIEDSLVLKAIAEIALNCWRLKQRLHDPSNGEPIEGMSIATRHVDNINNSLKELGIEIEDRTDQTFDVGLVQKAIAYEPTPGITKRTIIKTIKPTLRLKGQLIERGEVIVGTPQITG